MASLKVSFSLIMGVVKRSDEWMKSYPNRPLTHKLPIVRGNPFDTGNLDNPVVLDVQIELTPHTAVGAGCANLLGFPMPYPIADVLFHQCTHRTHLNTFTAENTIRIFQGFIVGGDDFGIDCPCNRTEWHC